MSEHGTLPPKLNGFPRHYDQMPNPLPIVTHGRLPTGLPAHSCGSSHSDLIALSYPPQSCPSSPLLREKFAKQSSPHSPFICLDHSLSYFKSLIKYSLPWPPTITTPAPVPIPFPCFSFLHNTYHLETLYNLYPSTSHSQNSPCSPLPHCSHTF